MTNDIHKTCLMLAVVLLVVAQALPASAAKTERDVVKKENVAVKKTETAKTPTQQAVTPKAAPEKQRTSQSIVPVEEPATSFPELSQMPQPSPSSPATGEQINWQVIASGGGSGESDNYKLSGTVAQTAVGRADSDNFGLIMGFWQDFGGGCCQPPFAGNVDCAGIVDIGDVTELIQLLFIRVGDPYCCEDEADLDYNEDIDIGDLSILINRLFITVTDPPPCP